MVRRRALPVERMWQDAEHWLPLALDGSMLRLVVVLNDDNETVREVLDYKFFHAPEAVEQPIRTTRRPRHLTR